MTWRFLPTVAVIAITYALTVVLVRAGFYNPANPAYTPVFGLDPRSGPWYAAALMTIPYIVGGLMLARQRLTAPRQVHAFVRPPFAASGSADVSQE